MTVFNGNNIKIGAGSLYAAPLGTTEPTSISGAWPSGWVALGYTDQGSEFNLTPAKADVTVEETYWPIKVVLTGYTGTLVFAMAETTRQNLALALNGGIGSSIVTAYQGTSTSDSNTIWQEVPDIGSEVRVMLGWDAIADAGTTALDPFGRLVARQCLQTGALKRSARKGNNKAMWAVEFSFEKPEGTGPGTMPFRFLQPASLAS